MNQRSRLGMTLLDVAKHCIEHFTNTVTAKLQQTVNVSYMLMNFDEDPVKALKVGRAHLRIASCVLVDYSSSA